MIKKEEIVKLIGSNVFANIFSALAFVIALLALLLSQWQFHKQNQDRLIFSTGSAFNENVYLVKENGAYFFKVPNRVILTNRSERNHPLQDMLFFVGADWQKVEEIYDKNRVKLVLPENIPPNESRVLFFYIRVPIPARLGEYLAANLPKQKDSTEGSLMVSTLFDLTEVFLGLEDKFMGAELIGVHSQGTLVYYFATTKNGERFEVKQELYLP